MMSEPIPISDEAAQRRLDIRDAWDRYDGQHPDSIQAGAGDTNDNVALNNLATIIDTGVDFLWGSGSGEVEFAAMRGDEEDEALTEKLAEVWDANRKKTLLRKTGVSGGIAGHFAWKLIPREGQLPRIVLLDPLDLVLQSDPQDIDRRIGYAIDTTIYDDSNQAVGRRREQHTLDDGGKSWTVQWLVTDTPLNMPGAKVYWKPDPQRPDAEVWPYEFAAIVDAQNMPNPHREWGRSDLSADILHINEQINRVASNEAKTLRHFAHPQPVATGENPKQIQGFIDASIGSVMCLPTGTDYRYAQMQADGLTASREYRDALTDKQFEVARVPLIAIGKVDNLGAASGVALLIMYRPLIAKTETKRDTYGDALRELNLRILALLGDGAADDVDVVNAWPDVLPKNLKEEADTGLLLLDLGVSRQTILERLGINFDREQERLAEEAGNPETDSHGLLTRLEELQAKLDAVEGRPTEPDPVA